jgi:hypothetical protein
LPLPLIVKYIKRYSLKEFIQVYEESRKWRIPAYRATLLYT